METNATSFLVANKLAAQTVGFFGGIEMETERCNPGVRFDALVVPGNSVPSG